MPTRRAKCVALSMGAFMVAGAVQSSARAQPDERVQEQPHPEPLTAPSLQTHPEAVYPQEAFAKRLEGNVGLELDLDAAGKVVGVRITAPAGHGFDEAAAEAARRFVFEPARRRVVPVASTVQFTYYFHLPPPPLPAAPPPPPTPAPLSAPGGFVQNAATYSTLVLGLKVGSSRVDLQACKLEYSIVSPK